MDHREGLEQAGQVLGGADRLGQGVVDAREHVDPHGDALGDPPGRQGGARRVDADDPAPADDLGHPDLLLVGGPDDAPVVVEHDEVGVAHLELAAELADPADEDAPGSHPELPAPVLDEVLAPEEDEGEAAAAVGERRLEAPAARIAPERLGADRSDLGQDGRALPRQERAEIAALGAAEVVARRVVHKLVERAHADGVEGLGGPRPEGTRQRLGR